MPAGHARDFHGDDQRNHRTRESQNGHDRRGHTSLTLEVEVAGESQPYRERTAQEQERPRGDPHDYLIEQTLA